jgi:tetratricopeptide (TPR) repeat protein
MDKRTILAAAIGLIVGATGGFLVANGLNRSELTELRGKAAQNSNLSENGVRPHDDLTIGDDEIRSKIAQADADPANFNYQKDLGGALYRYASMKNDSKLAAEALRILERAYSLDPKNYDVTVDLGNAYFDAGFAAKDRTRFEKAQELYEKALLVRPGDADVRTDLGISYLLIQPPVYKTAIDEFQKVLNSNPGHERAQLFLTKAYIQMGNWPKADDSLAKLKALNPKNSGIDDLAAQIAAKQAEPIK